MNGTRGIVLMIWKNRAYGYAAHNLAISIKSFSSSLPIHLITDDEAFKGCTARHLFDSIQMMSASPMDAALCKMQIYDKLPFDHNLFLDVDALCIGPMDEVMDRLIESEKEYRCAVHTWYDKNSPEKFPLMVWANKSVIWNHYGFTDEKLPACQSSIQYIRKGKFCENLFKKIQENYANKIPLENLENRWGGGQPDELYLNVTLAQIGYDPTLSGVIYFGDARTLSFTKIKEHHQILSMFGTAQNIKREFIAAYDKTLADTGRAMGIKPTLWKYIAGQKIANKSKNMAARNNGMGRSAFVKRFFPTAPTPTTPVKGKVYVYLTNLYQTINEARKSELMRCHEINCANPAITKIFNFGNLPYDHEKVVNIPLESRMNYQQMIDYANTTDGDYHILTNSDLYFDNTLNWLDKVNLDKVMLALCRYNLKNNRAILEAGAYSQGTWIFKGKINVTGCEFTIGLPGCENALAYKVNQQGYKVANPAKEIKAYHLHDSDFRTYTQADRIHENYMPVLISSILELQHKKVLIKQPGAVGDIICVLPIARHYADQGYMVEWLAPVQYHSMLSYADYVTPVLRETGKYDHVIDLSFGIDRRSKSHQVWMHRQRSLDSFVRLKYELANVSLDQLRNLKYTRDEKKESELFDLLGCGEMDAFALTHLNSHYGNPADIHTDLPCIEFRPVDGYTVFDWRKVIEAAAEIHAIDSCLVNFTDAIPVLGKLFYYITSKVPNQWDRTILVKEWNVVNQLEYATT